MENQKPTETARTRNSFLLSLILKIAAAAGVEISKATQAVYLEQLSVIPESELVSAVNRTIREWSEPSKMPPIAFILARAETNPLLAAEAAWETLQKLIYRDWHPDIGWTRK